MIVYETKLYQLARELFCHPSLNRKVYYSTITPDRAISSVWNAGQPAALNVTVTSPLQSSFIINLSDKSGFALSAAEDRKYEQYAQNCSEVGIQFIPLACETFGGLSETVRKTLKRIATLADNRNLQPAGLSVAFSRLSQSVSVTAIRGSAIMLLARDARL